MNTHLYFYTCYFDQLFPSPEYYGETIRLIEYEADERFDKLLNGLRWPQLRYATYADHHGQFEYLTDECLQYFLPAFLIMCFESRATSIFLKDVVGTLIPPLPPGSQVLPGLLRLSETSQNYLEKYDLEKWKYEKQKYDTFMSVFTRAQLDAFSSAVWQISRMTKCIDEDSELRFHIYVDDFESTTDTD